MRFTYLGGTEFDGTEMPAAVTMFGIKFIEGVAKDVLPGDFDADAKFQHAIAKLKGNQFFQAVNDDPGTLEVLDAPKAKRGRPAKVVAEDATYIEDAAE
jgi:hypothetical protein